MLAFATGLKIAEGGTQSNNNIVELANDGHCELTRLNARQATGLTVADSEENFTRTESMARWSREGRVAYEAGGENYCCCYFYFYSPV